MNNTNLKRGDVIAIDWDGRKRIAIFNEIRTSNDVHPVVSLHIYIEMDPTNKFESLIFKDKDYDFSYYLPSITYRLATEEEKTKLYNEICKYFAEEHDSEWYNHFTDSSYFDIQDYLLDIFCIEINEYDDDLIYPDFINEIHTYMWDQMCEFMGQPNKRIYIDDESEMVNKAEFIEKTIGYFTPILKTYCSEECVKELIDGFVNSMEE